MAGRRDRFGRDFDRYRAAIINEPRGSDVMVGALLCADPSPGCDLGVIFFNNVGMLGMCGHGTIGVVASLASIGRLEPGPVAIDTPVGPVRATLREDGRVTVQNVPSHRAREGVEVDIPGHGRIRGDIAWGGNWFFLAALAHPPIAPASIGELTALAMRVRDALHAAGHPEVDHVEFFAPAPGGGADSRNFVLCPGSAYDRSPCGTGTSAKLACLAAAGELAEGGTWIQESVIGSRFEGSFRWLDRGAGRIEPFITGRAHVTGEGVLLLDEDDPYQWGIPPAGRAPGSP